MLIIYQSKAARGLKERTLIPSSYSRIEVLQDLSKEDYRIGDAFGLFTKTPQKRKDATFLSCFSPVVFSRCVRAFSSLNSGSGGGVI